MSPFFLSSGMLIVIALVAVAIYMYRKSAVEMPRKTGNSAMPPPARTPRPPPPPPQPPTAFQTLHVPPTDQLPDAPPRQGDSLADYGLLNFSFESRVLGPGFSPDARAKMTQTTAAEDNYKLVKCEFANGYAVKWSGRYLSVTTDGEVEWNLRKDEPNTCWRVESGYCGGDGAKYIMMRSLLNNQFLRVDGKTKQLICVDAPTAENSFQYCWKFQKDGSIRQRCGTYYHPDYKRVVTIPCEIVKDPPEGGNCSDVTPGYMAKCCGRYPNDTSCRSVFIREVVGRGLNEAALYIKTRFPDKQILTCARGDACEHADPFPLYKSDLIVIPYDKRLGTVSAPAYRFI